MKNPISYDALTRLDAHKAMLSRDDNVCLADRVCELYQVAGGAPLVFDAAKLWAYNGRVWQALHDAEIDNLVASFSGLDCYGGEDKDGNPRTRAIKISNPKAVTAIVKAAPFRWGHGTGFFDDAPEGVAFASEFVQLKKLSSGEVHIKRSPLGPEHGARAQFDFDYDPLAKCLRFLGMLESMWGGEGDYRARVALLQEFIAACLFGMATRYHKALILQGEPGTGKSTLIEIVEALFPEGTVSHVGPSKFGDHNMLSMLGSSRLNTIAEASQGAILAQDTLKEVMEGRPQPLNTKYALVYTMRPKCGHLLAFNHMPEVPGADPSIWKRFAILCIDRVVRDTDREVKGIAKEIIASELQGIIAWVIEGGVRLVKKDAYTIPDCHHLALASWMAEADNVAYWLSEFVDVSGLEWTKASVLYKAYATWASEYGYRPVKLTTWGRRMKACGIERKKTMGCQHYGARVI